MRGEAWVGCTGGWEWDAADKSVLLMRWGERFRGADYKAEIGRKTGAEGKLQ